MDADNDDLNSLQEPFFGTDPNNPDTDGNGILDGDEDADGDGIKNKDEPTIFSLEGFIDPFADPNHNVAVLVEGSNLFTNVCSGPCFSTPADVVFLTTGATFHEKVNAKYNSQIRIYMLLTPDQAASVMGPLKVITPVGETNTLSYMPMHCDPGPPMLMKAAVVQLKTLPESGPYRDYVAIGGCNLIEREGNSNFARTSVRLADHDILIRAPYGGVGLLPSRIIVPAHSLAKPGLTYPFTDDIQLGNLVSIVTSAGASNAVPVESTIAQLRIPLQALQDDDDGDGLSSASEAAFGTDPVLWDTDHDGVDDGREIQRGTDPLDPDSN